MDVSCGESIGNMLRVNSTLLMLRFSQNTLGDEGVKPIFKGLVANLALETISGMLD